MRALLKPPALRRGDVIGLVAPAGAVWVGDRIDRAVRHLEGHGYRVELGRHCRGNHGAFAATDEHRADDLNRMFRDPRVRGVFALRGGYGTPRLLDRIDYAAVRRDPKVVVGYSDITALQLALHRRTGLVTFSGPLAAVELADAPDPYTEEQFWRMVASRRAPGDIPMPAEAAVVAHGAGTAEGPLLGGCLSLVNALLGTPYLPSLRGAVLVFEDVHEHVHRIDRMLLQLRLAGVFRRAAGAVFGQFTRLTVADPAHPHHDFGEVLGEFVAGLRIPSLTGFPYGHVPRKATLPLGVRVRLDTRRARLRVLEPAVA